MPGVRAGMLAEYQATSIIDAAAKATLKAARTGAEKNKTKKHAREDGRLTRLRKAASLARDAACVRLIKQSKRCKCYPLPCQTNRSASLTSAKKNTTFFVIPFVVCEASSDAFHRRRPGRSCSLLRMKQAWAETKLHARSDV